MCTNPDRPWPAWDGSFDYDLKSIIGRLEKNQEKIKATDCIYLTGGEPTLHPHFLDILKYLAKNFPEQRLKILSNGRRFSYSDFAKKVLGATDNLEIDMSLCGPSSQVHDRVTRTAGSFEQAKKGLVNLLKHKSGSQVVGIRTVLSRITYPHIGQTLSLLSKEFPSLDRTIVIFMEFEAQAIKNSQAIKINYGQVRPFINDVFPLLEKFKEIRFYHFPLCVVDPKLWPYLWRTLPKKEIGFVPACRKCQYKKLCLGIHKGYLKNISQKDFSPIRRKVELKTSGIIYRPIESVRLD